MSSVVEFVPLVSPTKVETLAAAKSTSWFGDVPLVSTAKSADRLAMGVLRVTLPPTREIPAATFSVRWIPATVIDLLTFVPVVFFCAESVPERIRSLTPRSSAVPLAEKA